MGLLDFVKDAGEKLFGSGKAKALMEAAVVPESPQPARPSASVDR